MGISKSKWPSRGGHYIVGPAYNLRMDPAGKALESALILIIPEAEDLVAPYRLQHDPGAALGIPAHITTLYPFLPPDQISDSLLNELAELFAHQAPIQVRFEATARFPGVLYLDPLPREPLLKLINTVSGAFPNYPPYGGIYPEIKPHLTVAQSKDPALLDQLEAEIEELGREAFPITSRVSEVTLFTQHPVGWSPLAHFPLGK